ncbi:hypothetical protein Tco_0871740 [Tanacetum coccineum]
MYTTTLHRHYYWAGITVPTQTYISLPPEAEVERLLTMTTPSPSPPILLSPPSAKERLARCTTPPAHSPPLLPSSGCPTQIQALRIASTQALIDAVTAALPSPPLPPLPPSLYIPPLVDRKDDIPESEQPPYKRLYLSTLGSRYEVGESSTARPTRGRGIDYGIVSTVDAEERSRISQRVDMDSQRVDLLMGDRMTLQETELQTHRDHVYAHETHFQAHPTQLQLHSTLIQTQHQVHETRFQMQQAELAALRETDRR